MSRFVQTADFESGELKIAFNHTSKDKLQEIIDRIESDVIKDLLGCTLSALFLADFDTNTGTFTEGRFIAIYEPIALDFDSLQIRSGGLKEMLKLFIYFETMRDKNLQSRETGFSSPSPENSVSVSGTGANLLRFYNRAVNDYGAIQCYVKFANPEGYDYSEFNGIYKTRTTWI